MGKWTTLKISDASIQSTAKTIHLATITESARSLCRLYRRRKIFLTGLETATLFVYTKCINKI